LSQQKVVSKKEDREAENFVDNKIIILFLFGHHL